MPFVRELPGLRYRQVDGKKTIAAQVVARADVARIGVSIELEGGDRIREQVRTASASQRKRILGGLRFGDLLDARSVSGYVPVGRPKPSLTHADRQAAGPEENAGYLPASDELIGEGVGIAEKQLAFADRQLSNPVRVDRVARVEIRHALLLSNVPRIDAEP